VNSNSPTSTAADPGLTLARRCAAAMWADDQASRRLGMQILDIAPGRSKLTMTVRGDMVNGHGSCHGGFLATLADSAFAFACNTYDEVTVAAGFDITFVAPALLGDELVAEAVERSRVGRSGLYDVTLTCSRAAELIVIAEFRGRSRSLGRPHLPVHHQATERDIERHADRSAP
jgi:acyl-CoA thioesterase